jgi:hypothetical protein
VSILTALFGILLMLTAICSLVPSLLFLFNLRRFRAPRIGRRWEESVAVLIPARNEEANIGACLESVLASKDVELAVWVCDDASTDRTALIVKEFTERDARLRLVSCPPLPVGWNGKQHACWKLARSGVHADRMLFLDADVRLQPWAIAACVATQKKRQTLLLSGFPKQQFSGFLDALLLPLIHFVLLSYLPMRGLQVTTKPAYSAGCGQFMLVERGAYFTSGGHAGIRATRHDGLRLPQVFREHGFRTDVVDLTRLAEVRMYGSARDTWDGLTKNATEGMAAHGRIWAFTGLLVLGQIVPAVLLLFAWLWLPMFWGGVIAKDLSTWTLAAFAIPLVVVVTLGMSLLPRIVGVIKFRQPFWSALLHPIGVGVLLILQWWAYTRHLRGKPVTWRQRNYAE